MSNAAERKRVLLTNRADLTLDSFYRVAWLGEGVAFTEAACARMADARAGFLRLLESDPNLVIYGVTSGYGQMAHLRFSHEERKAHARRPPVAADTSFGGRLPDRITRGIVFARLANFVEGHAAVSVELAEAVAGMLDEPALPAVPALGHGSAGEIQALSRLFGPLAQGRALGEKEALSLVNGSPCASALLADAALAARARLDLAVAVFALSIEAMEAPLAAYDAILEELWGDPHEAFALRSLRAYLSDAALNRRPYQAPVSWRILPRVLGQAARALAQAEEVAAISLRAVSDNPVYIPPDAAHPNGRAFSTGGYHNAKAYMALDDLAAAWADLSLLCDRHVTKLLDGKVSRLPENLMVGDGYPGCLAFTAVAYAEQARHAAQRTLLPGSEGGGFGQNDVAVPVFPAWRKEAEAAECLQANLAILSAIASQAFFATDRKPTARLAPLLGQIREQVAPVTDARALGPDAECLSDTFRQKIFAPVAAPS